MKFRLISIISLIILSLSGCATKQSYSVGRDYSSENISQIIKGKTTSDEMIKFFGEPFTKTVISDTEEKWNYMYMTGRVDLLSTSWRTKGMKKTLDVLITKGVVANFVYNEGLNPYAKEY